MQHLPHILCTRSVDRCAQRVLRCPSSVTTWRTVALKMCRGYEISRHSSSETLSHLLPGRIEVHPDVDDALRSGLPVVALESTIIAHGMPYPQNVELSIRLNEIFHQKTVVPATIAIMDGVCKIGLTSDEINDLALAGESGRAQKCSTREISLLLSQHDQILLNKDGGVLTSLSGMKTSNKDKHDRQHQMLQNNTVSREIEKNSNQDSNHTNHQHLWGATTVAATMRLASLAGISTFVTGGIGGVHRNGEITMDVSADLIELSRTPVVVVSAGIKSILDIPRTLEVLETYGVPAIAYRTDEFPAFFSPRSGVATPSRMDSPTQIAVAFLTSRTLHLPHGFLVAVPNEDPAGAFVEDAIQEALKEAKEHGVFGHRVTPFVLQRVADKTGGESLKSNMALVERNASVGADIAIAISQQKIKLSQSNKHSSTNAKMTSLKDAAPTSDNNVDASCTPIVNKGHLFRPQVVVYGGAVVDIIAKPLPNEILRLHTSNPSVCRESDGGVARNIAEVLARLGSSAVLYSAVGNDPRGKGLRERLRGYGIIDTENTISVIEGERSATYCAILNEKGDLHTACADMEIFHKIKPPPRDILERARMLVIDANPPLSFLRETVEMAKEIGIPVFFEPTSVAKATRVGKDDRIMSTLTYASPNLEELLAMAGRLDELMNLQNNIFNGDDLSQIKPVADVVLQRMNATEAHLLVTCGARGVVLVSKSLKSRSLSFPSSSLHLFPAEDTINVENTTGAGDTLAGAFLHSILQNGNATSDVLDAVKVGIKAAALSLRHTDAAISPLLSSFH